MFVVCGFLFLNFSILTSRALSFTYLLSAEFCSFDALFVNFVCLFSAFLLFLGIHSVYCTNVKNHVSCKCFLELIGIGTGNRPIAIS